MKYTPRRIVLAVSNRIGLVSLVCNVLELQKKPKKKYRIAKDRVIGIFNDSLGNKMELLSGLRDRIKPSWRIMINPTQSIIEAPSKEKMEAKIKVQTKALNRIENFLNAKSLSFVDKEILEIGAYDGSSAYAFASIGAKKVLATDMAAYYIHQTPGGVVSKDAVANKNSELNKTRESYSKIVSPTDAAKVSFVEDDIIVSQVASESMDVIVSWEVLEHITDPNEAFRHMSRILKKGGFAFHEYNPFFSVDGGHSLCTLDFPWGHARISDKDFERYLEEFRPNEKEVSLSFFKNNLNRMTLSHLSSCMKNNGLEPVSIIPWYSEDDQAALTNTMLQQCKKIHPSIEHVDMVAPLVWVLCKKI